MPARQILLAALFALAFALPAQAQNYPTRPVKIIVPTVAGGVVDVVTRLLAQQLTAQLGQGFVIDNRSGAGKTLGSREAARAEPDGYTLLMSSASGQVISPLIYKDAGYDPIKSFAPIALFAEGSIILVVDPKEPFHSVGDVVAQAKTNPGKLNYGSAGTGTIPHLTGELFKAAAGIDLVHVPYRGGALTIADLIAGNINMTFEGSGPLLPHIRDGRLRALGRIGNRALGGRPQDLTQKLEGDIKRWGPVVRTLNLRGE